MLPAHVALRLQPHTTVHRLVASCLPSPFFGMGRQGRRGAVKIIIIGLGLGPAEWQEVDRSAHNATNCALYRGLSGEYSNIANNSIHIHTHTNTHARTCTHTRTHMHTHMHTHTRTNTHTHARTHRTQNTHTHIRAHAYSQLWWTLALLKFFSVQRSQT